ncbi:MAG: hypothetical protein FJ280_00945 [Planctomycetes bacterium]|nr:hypothetical protein [Planctomycetota bacterium]
MSPRLRAEVVLLRQAAGGRSKVTVGPKTIDGQSYTAVLVANVRISTKKFPVTATDMLFLLPADYPRLPPIGCYLNYKWETADHHFTLQSHYGAPLLVGHGWYWYCVGLGGGFNSGGWAHRWRPAADPEHGHNLTTLFVAARHAINHQD